MSESHEDLKIPTHRLAVEIALRDGERRDVHLFLALEQSLASLLADTRHFVPVYVVADDAFLLLSKAALGWLAVARSDELEGELELFDEDHAVEIRLADGTSLRGDLMYSPPAGEARTIDHLNAEQRYVQLYDAERIYFIDKDFVEWVRERRTGEAE